MNVKDLISAIRTIVREEIKFLQKFENNRVNSMNAWTGYVTSVNSSNNTAEVMLPFESSSTSPKMNKTGQTLVNGDEVILFSLSGKLDDAFIFAAKKQYS